MEEYAEYAGHKLMAVVDMIHVEQLFDDISGIIGDEVNLLFRQRFLAAPACELTRRDWLTICCIA